MERLPKEVTKGKAATYKLVKLKKSVSYFDSTIRATQKFNHAITTVAYNHMTLSTHVSMLTSVSAL